MLKKKRIQVDPLSLVTSTVKARFEYFVFRRAMDTAASNQAVPQKLRWAFATDYGFAIRSAVIEFTDLLTQTLVSRGITISEKWRRDILEEARSLVAGWKDWENAKYFLAISMGVTDGDYSKIPPTVRDAFLEEVNAFAGGYSIEVINAIRVRCLVSGLPPSQLPAVDKTSLLIRKIKKEHPEFSQREICRRLDVYNSRAEGAAPLLETWMLYGHRLWVDAYDDPRLNNRVKKHISSVSE